MSDKISLLNTLNTRLKKLNKYKVNSTITHILSNIQINTDLESPTDKDITKSSINNNISNINNIESIKIGSVNITKNEEGHMIANLPNNSGYEIKYNLNTKTYQKIKT